MCRALAILHVVVFVLPVQCEVEAAARVATPLRVGSSRLFADVSINSKPAGLFLINTGSRTTLISGDLAKSLALIEIVGKAPVSSSAEPTVCDIATVPALSVAGVMYHDVHVGIDDNYGDECRAATGECIQGALGMDVLGRSTFVIDFAEGTLQVNVPIDPAAGAEVNGSPYPILLKRGVPLVRCDIEGDSSWFCLDTGFTPGLQLSHAFARMHPDLTEGRPRSNDIVPWDTSAEGYLTRLSRVTYCGRSLENVHAEFEARDRGMDWTGGVLGCNAFQDCRVAIDCGNRQLWVRGPKQEDAARLVQRLSRQKDLNRNSRMVLSAFRLRSDAIAECLKAGDDPNAANGYGVTSLIAAAGRGDAASVRLLLSARARLTPRTHIDGYTALLMACQRGRTETATLLLDAGANVNEQTESGRSALFLAVDFRAQDLAGLLIDRGAKVDLPIGSGQTPLMCACRNDDPAIATLLLKHGANPNAACAAGTPLSYAAGAGSLRCVKLLLEGGAQVNKAAADGRTPLMAACANLDAEECVEQLLRGGADPSAHDRTGLTARDHALRAGNTAALKLLENGR